MSISVNQSNATASLGKHILRNVLICLGEVKRVGGQGGQGKNSDSDGDDQSFGRG